MSNKVESLFPTLIYQGTVPRAAALNRGMREEIRSFSKRDTMGRRWSQVNYRGGYTSYASLNDLHYRTPLFARLAELLQPHANAFAKAQSWDLRGLDLSMTDLWINVMPKHTYHSSHLHPHSVVSGSYYVSAPAGSVSLKLEDPRMVYYMNAPVRNRVSKKKDLHYEVIPKPGSFVLFESWLRHEVPPNLSSQPRISLSFNYELTPRRSHTSRTE